MSQKGKRKKKGLTSVGVSDPSADENSSAWGLGEESLEPVLETASEREELEVIAGLANGQEIFDGTKG